MGIKKYGAFLPAFLHRACVGLFSMGVKKYGLFPYRAFLHRACVGLFSMNIKKYGAFLQSLLGFSLWTSKSMGFSP